MRIHPPRFTCSVHGTDLTPLVKALVATDPSEVAAFGVANATPRRRKGTDAEPFLVVVSCPGDGAPHDVECPGTFSND